MSQPIAWPFADLPLSRRLEAAEGHACAQYAVARRGVFPDSRAEARRIAGADVVFDGVDSPVTQTFGLGMFEAATASALEQMERFFAERGAAVNHEVSPFCGAETLQLLCSRGYQPIELSSVMYRPIVDPTVAQGSGVKVRIIDEREAKVWSEVSARAWASEHPEFYDFLLDLGVISAARQDSFCFLGEVDAIPAAAAVLSLHQGVALLGGSATVPEFRRRGLHSALLRERMRHAWQRGCDIAMMVAQPGSDSQRNAERQGFRIAYSRIKWQLANRAD